MNGSSGIFYSQWIQLVTQTLGSRRHNGKYYKIKQKQTHSRVWYSNFV